MEIVFYFLALVFGILGAKYFYDKRNGLWLSFAVLDIAMYSALIFNFFARIDE